MMIVGLDLGASKIAAIVKNGPDSVFFREKLSSSNLLDTDKNIIENMLLDIKNTNSNSASLSIVLSSAATVDERGVVTRWPNREYWVGFNIGSFIENILRSTIIIEDDGNTAAFAEAKARSMKNLLYIGIGSGVSGGIILFQKVWRGMNNCAGEFGHVSFMSGGKKCKCGRRGCLQTYVSGPEVLKSAFGEGYDTKNKNDLVNAFRNGDTKIRAILGEVAEVLAHFITAISEVMDITSIVVGGGFGSDFEELYTQISFCLQKMLRNGQRSPQVTPSYYGADSSLMGAMLMAEDIV